MHNIIVSHIIIFMYLFFMHIIIFLHIDIH